MKTRINFFVLDNVKKLNSILSERDQVFLLFLCLFTALIVLIEIFLISSIIAYFNLVTDFDYLKRSKYLIAVFNLLKFTDVFSFIKFFSLFLLFFLILRFFINISYQYLLNTFSHGSYYLLSKKLFEQYLDMPFKSYLKRNPAILIKNITTEVHYLTLLVSSFLFMLSEVFISVLIYLMLIVENWQLTLCLSIFGVLSGYVIVHLFSKRIEIEGEARSYSQDLIYKILNSSFANFKFIKLSIPKKKLISEYSKGGKLYSSANIKSQVLMHIPRLYLETVGFLVLLAIVLYFLIISKGAINQFLGIITLYFLAMYRFLPSVNRILMSYNQILFYNKSLDIIYRDFTYCHKEILGEQEIKFNKELILKDVSIFYDENEILTNVNLKITKGEKIAFIGESGQGKTTLIDIIIGIHLPTKGSLYVDGLELNLLNLLSWRQKIGYIPQDIYLFEGTLEENVVFGRDFNEERVISSLEKAQIWDFFKNKDGLKTMIGEGGVTLSGGQKQRVGIARALYGMPEILVLDEATSALDITTEAEIINEIFNLADYNNLTIIIVTHRMNIIEKCDKIFLLENKKVTEIFSKN